MIWEGWAVKNIGDDSLWLSTVRPTRVGSICEFDDIYEDEPRMEYCVARRRGDVRAIKIQVVVGWDDFSPRRRDYSSVVRRLRTRIDEPVAPPNIEIKTGVKAPEVSR